MHINCGMGISVRRYTDIINQQLTLNWVCASCISIRRNRTAVELGHHTLQRDEPERQCSNPIEPNTGINDTEPLVYTLITNGSNKNKDILVDNMGYTYTKNDNSRGTTHWRCRFNNKPTLCKYKLKHMCPGTSDIRTRVINTHD